MDVFFCWWCECRRAHSKPLFGYLLFQANPRDHTVRQQKTCRMETDSLTPWVQYLYRLPSRTPQESWYHLQSSCSQLGEIQPPSPTNQSSPSRWAISSKGGWFHNQVKQSTRLHVTVVGACKFKQLLVLQCVLNSFCIFLLPIDTELNAFFSQSGSNFLCIESELSPEIGPALLFCFQTGNPYYCSPST